MKQYKVESRLANMIEPTGRRYLSLSSGTIYMFCSSVRVELSAFVHIWTTGSEVPGPVKSNKRSYDTSGTTVPTVQSGNISISFAASHSHSAPSSPGWGHYFSIISFHLLLQPSCYGASQDLHIALCSEQHEPYPRQQTAHRSLPSCPPFSQPKSSRSFIWHSQSPHSQSQSVCAVETPRANLHNSTIFLVCKSTNGVRDQARPATANSNRSGKPALHPRDRGFLHDETEIK